jgi:hypothetical protein
MEAGDSWNSSASSSRVCDFASCISSRSLFIDHVARFILRAFLNLVPFIFSLTKKLVSRFVQTPFGTAGICREVTDQFTREFVDVGTFEVVELLSLEIENDRAKDDRYVDATTVEYFSVHDQPAYRGSLGKAALVGGG